MHPLAEPLIELGDDLVGHLAELLAQPVQALLVGRHPGGGVGDAPLRLRDLRPDRGRVPPRGGRRALRVGRAPLCFGQPGANGRDLGLQRTDPVRERLIAALVRMHAGFQLVHALAAEPYLAAGAAHRRRQLVQALLRCGALAFQALDRVAVLPRAGRGRIDLVLDAVPLLRLAGQPIADAPAALPQRPQAQQLQVAFDLERLRAQRAVAIGRLRLGAQRLIPALHLAPDVLYLRHVGGRLSQLPFGFGGAGPVGQDAGRLLEDRAPLLRLLGEDAVDPALLQRGVAGGGQAGIGEQLAHVAQPALRAVDEVLALTGAVQAALDGDLGGRDRQPLVLIGEDERHLGHAHRPAAAGAVEDHVLHPLGAQRAGRLLAQRPADGVHDVALSAAVGADERRHVRAELQYGTVGKGFEAE